MLKQKFVGDGIILSTGTNRIKHLMEKTHCFLENLDEEDLTKEDYFGEPVYPRVNNHKNKIENLLEKYSELDTLEFEQVDVIYWYFHEELYRLMRDLAPEGFYFGSSEGDGACIGYFKHELE